MKVKNISLRVHHIGNVSILPGEEAEIEDIYAPGINKSELEEVKSKKAVIAEDVDFTEVSSDKKPLKHGK